MAERRWGGVAAGIVLAALPIALIYLLLPAAVEGDRRAANEAAGAPPQAHPDFPTPAAAGTQAVFLLEEPPRAPRVQAVDMPDRSGLAPTLHAYCELEAAQVTCSPALEAPAPGAARFRVERRASLPVLVEQLRPDGRAAETFVLAWAQDGTPLQVARLDALGVLDWVRELGDQGRRFGERRRSGANQLAGCGAIRQELDGQGRATTRTCLEWGGRPMLDAHGVATRRLTRDAQGFVSAIAHLGLDGEPRADHFGVQQKVLERDPDGRVTLERYLDPAGRPVVSAEVGCAAQRVRFAPSGLPEETACLGVDGAPTPSAQGYALERREHDARGCLVRRLFLGPDGAPQADVHGVAGHVYRVDESCWELADTCVDAAQRPRACGPAQPARYEHRYDARGQLQSVRSYGADGLPGQDPEYGVFEVRLAHDAWGNRTREACYDPAGEPVDCGGTGFHEIVREPDEAGRSVRETFVDPRGNPARNLSTWVRVLAYDNYDHLSETRSLDMRGGLVESLGMAIRRQLYDRGHRLFAVLLFDAQDRPARYAGCFTGATCPSEAWHAVRVVRAPNGRVLKNQFFDAGRRLVQEIDCARARCFQ